MSGDCTIFYSWHSQLPNATNRGFIEDALKKALKSLRDDAAVEELPEITKGPGNEPGSPNIGDAILAQLDAATAVVFDVSLVPVGDVPEGDKRDVRPAPNANVLVELGYTLKSAGHERIILVMNTAYGKPEQLPFDFRQRYVVTYELAEGQDKAEARSALVSKLGERLKRVIALPQRNVPPLVLRLRDPEHGTTRNQPNARIYRHGVVSNGRPASPAHNVRVYLRRIAEVVGGDEGAGTPRDEGTAHHRCRPRGLGPLLDRQGPANGSRSGDRACMELGRRARAGQDVRADVRGQKY